MDLKNKRDPRAHKSHILSAALALAPKIGYSKLTQTAIAEKAGVPSSLLPYYFGTMTQLRRDLMREAIRVECLPVIAQGLSCRDRHALRAPLELRHRSLQFIAES